MPADAGGVEAPGSVLAGSEVPKPPFHPLQGVHEFPHLVTHVGGSRCNPVPGSPESRPDGVTGGGLQELPKFSGQDRGFRGGRVGEGIQCESEGEAASGGDSAWAARPTTPHP